MDPHATNLVAFVLSSPQRLNQIGSVAFSFSTSWTELTLSNVVVANPAGDYRTPFLMIADRITVHLKIWQICAIGSQVLLNQRTTLAGHIEVPFLMVNDLQ